MAQQLEEDIQTILTIIEIGKHWDPAKDKQLNALEKLCTGKHAEEKIIVFTQFADTARYLYEQLSKRGGNMACVTGNVENPSEYDVASVRSVMGL